MKDSINTSPTLISRYVGVASLLGAFEGLAAIQTILQIPGELENALYFGLSAQRLILVAFLAIGIVAFVVLGLICILRADQVGGSIQQWTKKRKGLKIGRYLFIFSTAAVWCALLTPSYQFGRYQAYYERIQPLIVWLALVLLQGLLVWLFTRHETWREAIPHGILYRGSAFWPTVTVFLAFLAVWGVMAWSGLGFRPDNVHWNDAGAPILPGQIAASFLAGVLIYLLERWVHSHEKLKKFQTVFDLAVFLLIWAMAAVIWIGQPLPHSFFAPGPYPPNNELYPFSDAAQYDLGAQYALIGQGLLNKLYVDKPMFSAFLVVLHVIAGQQYIPVVNLQAAFIAVFPALLYLIGRKLHSRAAGAVAACLIIFREVNTIQITRWVLASSTKVLMSEPLTTVGIVFFVLFLIMWIKSEPRKLSGLAAAGGCLGLTTLVRHNPWFLIPSALLVILIVEWKHWRNWILGTVIFLLAFCAAISPWMLRNQLNNGKPFYFIVPFDGVLMRQRYDVGIYNTPVPTTSPSKATPIPGAEIPPTVKPQNTSEYSLMGIVEKVPRMIVKAFQFVPDHFFHNLLATSTIFPSTLVFNDLEHIIREPGSIWDTSWTGRLSIGKTLILLIFLGLVSIGIGNCWRKWKWAGVTPALIFIGYDLATAAARTSGARYIQPADWVALFYLAVGLIQIGGWLKDRFFSQSNGMTRDETSAVRLDTQKSLQWKILIVFGLVFIAGSLPYLSELIFPVHFPNWNESTMTDEFIDKDWTGNLGFSPQELRNFLKQDQAVLLFGRGLYPRYYGIGQGESDRFSAYREQNYPRLVITTIGQDGMHYGALPLQHAPESFPNGSDVFVIGCAAKDKPELDLAAIVVTAPEIAVYRRDPAAPLTCPLPEPVCDDNRVCR